MKKVLSSVGMMLLLAGRAGAQCDIYRAGVPDLDQRRSGSCSLPMNGVNYCIPTSNANWLAYINNNGFPAVLGGFRDWQQAASYCAATNAIFAQGQRMGTDPNSGTWIMKTDDGLRDELNDRVKDYFVVTDKHQGGSYAPTPKELYDQMLQGAMVNLGIGWYWRNTSSSTWDRRGGHGITLWALQNACNVPSSLVRIMDPDDGNASLTTQSTFATRDITFTQVFDRFHEDYQIGNDQRNEYRTDSYASGGFQGFMEYFVAVKPKYGTVGSVVLGKWKAVKPPPPGGGTPPATSGHGPCDDDHTVIGSAVHRLANIPDGSLTAVALDSTSRPGRQFVALYFPCDMLPITIHDDLIDPRLGFSRMGDLYLVDAGTVQRYSYVPDLPGGPGGGWSSSGGTSFGGGTGDIRCDDVNDRVVILSADPPTLRFYTYDLQFIAASPLSPSLPLPPPQAMAISPVDGDIFVTGGGLPTVYRFRWQGAAAGLALIETIDAPGIQPGSSLCIDDISNLYYAAANHIEVLSKPDAASPWMPRPENPFFGTPTNGVFDIAFSRSNGVRLAARPPTEFQLPPDPFPSTPVTFCVADVDDGSGTGAHDGGVTIDDLLYYLSLFGQGSVRADVDDGSATGTGDGGVTIEDLLYFLVRFGAGC